MTMTMKMMKPIIRKIVIPFLLLISSPVYSFGLRASAEYGAGEMRNTDKSIPARKMVTTVFSILPGPRFSGLLIGPVYEYRMIDQLEKTSSQGDINLGGKGWLAGGGILLTSFPMVNLLFQYYFFGVHNLESNNQQGMKVTYQKPAGFKVGAEISLVFIPATYLAFSYYKNGFKEVKVGSTATDISQNQLIDHGITAGLSLKF